MKTFSYLLVVLIYVLSIEPIEASDSINIHKDNIVCYTGNFNFDCFIDTLYCKEQKLNFWVPYKIKWGFPDTTLCNSPLPDSVRKDSLMFKYPDSCQISGSFFTMLVNNDTVSDLVFHFRFLRPDSSNYIDSTRFICIFGQDSLLKLDTIKIIEIDTSQNNPFFAREMRIGFNITEYMDILPGNSSSYKINSIYLYVNGNEECLFGSDSLISNIKESKNIIARAIPNPTKSLLSVVIETDKNSDVVISIYDNQGIKRIEKEFNIFSNKQKLDIDISHLVNGYYTLVLSNKKIKILIEKIIKIN